MTDYLVAYANDLMVSSISGKTFQLDFGPRTRDFLKPPQQIDPKSILMAIYKD